MGAGSIMNGNSDLDAVRAERQNRLNPPDYAPGQGDDDMDDFFDDDLFGDSPVDTGGGTQPSLGLGLDSPVGGFSPQPMGLQPTVGAQQPQQQGKAMEDRVFDAVVAGGKGFFGFAKEFVESFKGLTPKFWSVWGSNTFIVSCVVTVLGLILLPFGVTGVGVNCIIGGLLSAGTGGLVLMLNTDKAKNYTSMYADGDPTAQPTEPMADNLPMSDFSDEGEDDFFSDDLGDEDDDDLDGFDFEDSDDYDDDDEDVFEEEEDDFFSDSSFVSTPVEQEVSPEEALNSMVVPDNNMYVRQYLYEMFTKVLKNNIPDFAKIKTVDEDSDIFLQWEVFVRDACSATGMKDENLPDLLKLEENMFTIKLTITRPVGLKHEAVADELARIYAYSSGEYNSLVSAKAEAFGKNCLITIFTGETGMITLKDMYGEVKDFMLDNKNYMPVVVGVNPQGKVITADFKKMESVIITGMPRSGKSWSVKSILIQMCAFVPPTELNIYICDPKEGISDFKSFRLPHVKKFVSGDSNIVATLREVVKVLAPKRKKIIGDAGYQTIWDYKEVHPEVHMPVIYVLIDEVVTLASRMDKETNNEFRMLLRELISQLPALGIRAFLIPHVLNNDIIEKKTSDIVDCKISVCGDADHIEKATGSKPKEFPYKLANKGDMAVRMPMVSPSTMFIHAPVICETNPQINAVFEYMEKMWGRLHPEEVATSVGANAESERANQQALDNLNLDDVDDIDIFDNTPVAPVKGVSNGEIGRQGLGQGVVTPVNTPRASSSVNTDAQDAFDLFDSSNNVGSTPTGVTSSGSVNANTNNSSSGSSDSFDDFDDSFDF